MKDFWIPCGDTKGIALELNIRCRLILCSVTGGTVTGQDLVRDTVRLSIYVARTLSGRIELSDEALRSIVSDIIRNLEAAYVKTNKDLDKALTAVGA